MTNKNMEMMKKLIQAQKQKSAEQGGADQHNKKIGEKKKAVKRLKKGGLFDK